MKIFSNFRFLLVTVLIFCPFFSFGTETALDEETPSDNECPLCFEEFGQFPHIKVALHEDALNEASKHYVCLDCIEKGNALVSNVDKDKDPLKKCYCPICGEYAKLSPLPLHLVLRSGLNLTLHKLFKNRYFIGCGILSGIASHLLFKGIRASSGKKRFGLIALTGLKFVCDGLGVYSIARTREENLLISGMVYSGFQVLTISTAQKFQILPKLQTLFTSKFGKKQKV